MNAEKIMFSLEAETQNDAKQHNQTQMWYIEDIAAVQIGMPYIEEGHEKHRKENKVKNSAHGEKDEK